MKSKERLKSYAVRLTAVFLVSVFMSTIHAGIYAQSPQDQIYDQGANRSTESQLESYADDTAWYDPTTGACDPNTLTALRGNDNIEIAFNYFLDKGLTPEQSAGIVGNLRQESGVNPSADNPAASGGGGGIAQWEGGRWSGPDGLLAFAQENDKPWDDLGLQLDFIWHEMPNQFAFGKLGELQAVLPQATAQTSSLDAVKMSQTYQVATHAFEYTYERAGDPRMENRVQYASEVLALYGGSVSGGAVAGSGCGGSGILVGNYAFPLEPQTKINYSNMPCEPGQNGYYDGDYTDSHGRTSRVRTCHHDGSPAFDLSYGGVGNKSIYAITDGIIDSVRQFGTCNSINFRANTSEDKSWYWYGHIVAEGVSNGQSVNAGDRIGFVAPESYGPSCWMGGVHLHIDRGCIIGDYTKADDGVIGVSGPQPGGTSPRNGYANGGCREPGFLDDLRAIWEALPEA